MTFYFDFISRVLDMVKQFTKQNTKTDDNLCLQGTEIKFGNPYTLGFPISPLATSLKEEFPRKECPCMLNPMFVKLKEHRKMGYPRVFVGIYI